jgi:hypothetical protein
MAPRDISGRHDRRRRRRVLALSLGVRGITDNVYNAGSDVAHSARRHAVSFVNDIEATVRRNPQGAVVATLGLGIIIGMMLRSR